MSYANELVQLLRPLGVYSFLEGTFSLGELQALGGELDELEAVEIEGQKQSIVMTATEEGLSRMEALFRYRSAASTIAARRAAIAAFLSIGGDDFTLEALQQSLLACGVECLLREVGINHVELRFPQVMGVPQGFETIRIIAEDLLPCQLQIDFFFRYCTWGDTEDYGLTWGDLNAMTWDEWRHYTEE